MIKLDVSRNGMKKRYELEFTQGRLQWAMYLDDDVYNDPRRFSSWIKSLVQDTQLKKGN